MELEKDNQPSIKPKRTEEIQHIIDRMPTKFGYWITYLVLFMVVSMLIMGWLVKYHNVASGTITINTEKAPVKLVSNIHGRIKLLQKTNQLVDQGEIIAYIQNPASLEDIVELKSVFDTFSIDKKEGLFKLKSKLFQKRYVTGDLSTRYFQFHNR